MVLPKVVYKVNEISVDIPMAVCVKIETNSYGIAKAPNNENNLWGGGGVEGLSLPDFKTWYKTTLIKTVVLLENRHRDQWDKVENLEINAHIYGQMISDKGAKTRERSLFNKWGGGEGMDLNIKE